MTGDPIPNPKSEIRHSALAIRPACAVDAEAIAEILVAAFPPVYRFRFGLGTEEAAFLLADLYRGGYIALDSTWVAELAERVVGVVILYDVQSARSLKRGGRWRLFQYHLGVGRGLRAWAGDALLTSIFAARIPRGHTAYLETLAVQETERGRGIGGRLVEHGCALAWQ